MTGDWGGLRDRLINWGLTPTANYSATLQGNPVGGMRKGIKYAGLLNVYLDFDLEKLLKLGGTRLVVSGAWAYGENLSAKDIGNFFTVSNVFNGKFIGLYQCFIESNVWMDRLTFAVGRMGIGDDFGTADVFGIYVSSVINANPISLTYNIPAYLSNPDAALGTRFRVKPVNDLYIAAGVYNADPDAAVNRRVSIDVDFSFDDGVILISEIGYTPGSNAGSAGLPGDYKFGAYYDTGEFNELADSENTREGNYGFYLIADQMVYREPGKESQGLTLWAAATYAPEEEINVFPFFIASGFAYEGVFAWRDKDVAGFSFAYGKLSRDLEDQDYEIGLEGTYIFQVTPWLGLQPDVQLIVHPGGSGSIPDALVAGMQVSVDI
ncbi:MAG: carbohydrate porin [Thermodesulfobacteriota bacterium]